MQYKEYGHSREKTILLLHGGGLSWWNYREAAEMLKNTYHIIIPVLDGHAGSDRHFTSI
ncbi:MAG TPA: alpha/beta hydrolase, partial [Ruminococcus sp.]|nr:alpha/beta hydrolase [Ruminococcus sp.]